MKNLLKKIVSMTIALSLILSLCNIAFAEEFENTDDMTMQYLEDELKAYLEENHPDIVFGTADFVSYIMGVLLENADEELASLPDYTQIRYYAGEYLHELDQAQVEMTEPMETFTTSDEFRAKTIAEIKEEVRLQDLKDAKLYEQARSAREARASSYNVDAAVAYARRYALSSNLAYDWYIYDCTNYVSQIVYAGGIPMKKLTDAPQGIKDTIKHWYSITEEEIHGSGSSLTRYVSTSWINVDDFYDYHVRYGSAWVATVYNLEDLVNRVKAGDVVQLRDSGGDWFHSIFVTGINKDGEMAYCGHTTNRKDKPLTSLTGANQYRILSFD